MIDALGCPQTAFVLGGTSDIALAVLERLVDDRLRTVVLAGRDRTALEQAAERLRARGATTVEVEAFDALDPSGHERLVDSVFDRHENIDVVLVAFGVLGDQHVAERDPAEAARIVATNHVGVVTTCLPAARRLEEQGNGVLVLLSSVAGERARRSNFVYGSSKAGADTFAQGLADRLRPTGARVLIVRPGFISSSMTAGLDVPPLASTPEAVADAVAEGIAEGKDVVYAPPVLRWVFTVLRHLPGPIFRRLPV